MGENGAIKKLIGKSLLRPLCKTKFPITFMKGHRVSESVENGFGSTEMTIICGRALIAGVQQSTSTMRRRICECSYYGLWENYLFDKPTHPTYYICMVCVMLTFVRLSQKSKIMEQFFFLLLGC